MSDKLREAAKAALDLLIEDDRNADRCIRILEAPLAEPKQEPVAWTTMPEAEDWCFVSSSKDPTGKLEGKWFPLYAAPPRREWVGLTAEDINQFETWFDEEEERKGWVDPALIAKYFEAKLREKNT